MTPELIAIIAVGIALATLLIGLMAWLRSDLKEQDKKLNDTLDAQGKRIDTLTDALVDVRERLARLEGLIEGLFQPRPVSPTPHDPDHHEKAA